MVSNQNLSIEMFLTRLIYLSMPEFQDNTKKNKDLLSTLEKKNDIADLKTDPVSQIKNISQEKKVSVKTQPDIKALKNISINSFDQLLEVCTINKEIKLKYELEKNVNLVNFEKNRVEISFNENLDKNFVKDLSLKLYEWTGQRWIITFSKLKGDISVKEKEENKKKQSLIKAKKTEIYNNVIEKFSDALLIEVNPKKD